MPAPYSSDQVRKAGQAFWTPAGGGLAILVAIHLTPKPLGEQNIRLAMTVAYFACIFVALWALGKPRDDYMKALYGWRYREGGPALEQHVRLYLSALNRLVTALTAVLAVFTASIAIKVFAKWPQLDLIVPAVDVAGWAWWLSLLALLAFPVWGRSRISNVSQRHQLLREALDTADFTPQKMPSLGQPTQTQIIREAPAVEAVTEGISAPAASNGTGRTITRTPWSSGAAARVRPCACSMPCSTDFSRRGSTPPARLLPSFSTPRAISAASSAPSAPPTAVNATSW